MVIGVHDVPKSVDRMIVLLKANTMESMMANLTYPNGAEVESQVLPVSVERQMPFGELTKMLETMEPKEFTNKVKLSRDHDKPLSVERATLEPSIPKR